MTSNLKSPTLSVSGFVQSIQDAGMIKALRSCAPRPTASRLGNLRTSLINAGLTHQEANIVDLLLAAKGPQRASQIDAALPGFGARDSSACVRTMVSYLRGKLGADAIDTIGRGNNCRGYVITQTGRQLIAAMREAT